MDLLCLLTEAAIDGPPTLIMRYLGHHGAQALGFTCKTLQVLLSSNEASWWKDFVVKELDPFSKLDTNSEGFLKISHADWRVLSELVHSHLRKRTALKPLKLDPEHHPPPTRGEGRSNFYGNINYNLNENLCLLMGNNNSPPELWQHLPIRHKDRHGKLVKIPSCGIAVAKAKKTAEQMKMIGKQWNDSELQLLAKAGHHGMQRVGRQARAIIDMLQKEMPCLPPISSHGKMSIDPQLRVDGLGNDGSKSETSNTLCLPICPDMLDQIIQNADQCKCVQASFGKVDGLRSWDKHLRSCWSIDLGKDIHVTNPLFQSFLDMPSKTQGSRLRSTMEDVFLPAVFLSSTSAAGQTSLDSLVSQNRVFAKPNKMHIYTKGGKFNFHRDRQHGSGHFGTLVIVLPVKTRNNDDITGGELVIRSQHEDGSFGSESHDPPTTHANWYVFTLGTAHEVKEATNGYRVALTYTLWVEDKKEGGIINVPRAPDPEVLSFLGSSIDRWLVVNNALEELVEFVLPLQHSYSSEWLNNEAGGVLDSHLTNDKLRGIDAWTYRGLLDAFKDTGVWVCIEYHAVAMGVREYEHCGVVRRYGNLGAKELPVEERSKVVWLNGCPIGDVHPANSLVESKCSICELRPDEIGVFCLSIRHENYGCRASRYTGGYLSQSANWTHPDDVVLAD